MFFQFWILIQQFFPFLVGFIQTNAYPHPLDSQQEEKYLKLAKEGDQEARAKLIEHNQRLVVHLVKKFGPTQQSFEDLISIGTIGLIKAIDTFDASKGHKLTTYASRCIENAILSQMRLWFQTSPLKAEKIQNGVLWHRFPRTSISFVPLREAM